MMLTFFFALPLLAAVLCLCFDRVVDTRLLGFGGALVLTICAGLLFAARANDALALVDQPWLTVDNQTIRLALAFDAASWGFALLVAAGGALSLLALALALPRGLRGYGSLIAALLLLAEATLVGLASNEVLLLPIAWAALPLLGFTALRASGGQIEAQMLPLGLLGNLLGAVLLLGAGLSIRFGASGGDLSNIAPVGMLLAGMLALGLPPFHRGIDDMAQAPANVAAPLIAFGLPLAAGFVLTRFVAQTSLASWWHNAFQIIGLVVAVVCGAGALRERRLGQIIGWQASAQFGLLLMALGLAPGVVATTAPALLLNTALSLGAGLIAVGVIERRAGTDSVDEIKLGVPLLLPGAGLLVAAASSIGVPGTWGFWALRWLFADLSATTPLLIGPLLGGFALLAVAWLAPLVAFLRVPKPAAEPKRGASLLALACPLIAALPLITFGIAPWLVWNNWLEEARTALLGRSPVLDPLAEPVLPNIDGSIFGAASIVLLLLFVLVLRRISSRRTLQDAEIEPAGVLTPDGLGESLRGVGWLGAPSVTFAQVWEAFAALSRRLSWALSFFEQRYFMAGLMLAVVAVILLLLQG